MDLRGPILAMYQYPTLVIFCEGQGIATAKALVETQPSEGGLNFPYREDVRMYYRVRDSLTMRSAPSVFCPLWQLPSMDYKASCALLQSRTIHTFLG